MSNAKKEFLSHTVDRQVLCVTVTRTTEEWEKLPAFLLPCNYTPQQLKAFYEELDFEYHKGYGTQYIEGTIWYTDGTWSTRQEYDGYEWWGYSSCPEIPKSLRSF